MKAFGKIDSQFWTDKDLRSISQNARYLALYLPSCPHGDMLGVFKLPFVYAIADLQWEEAQLLEPLQELADIEYLTFNEEHEFVCLNEFQQSTPPTNSNQVAARVKLLEKLPVIDLDINRPMDLLLSSALSFKNSEEYQKRIERVRERFGKGQQSQSTRERRDKREDRKLKMIEIRLLCALTNTRMP